MRGLTAAVVAVVLLSVLFLVGLMSGLPAILMPALCAWTPAILWLGYAFGRAGVQVRAPIAFEQSQPAQRRAASSEGFN